MIKKTQSTAFEGSLYSRKTRAQFVDEDGITSKEDGFMLGYEEGFDDMDDLFSEPFDGNMDEIL